MPGTDAALAYGLMHVLIRDGFVDRDYVDRHTVGYEALAARAAEWTPARVAAICGIAGRAGGIAGPRLRHDAAGGDPVELRHAARAPAAATPFAPWPACRRSPARGAIPRAARCCRRRAPIRSTTKALERPDLIRGTPRTINMSAIGDALTAAEPPVRAIFVYNSNPVAVAPDSAQVARGFARDDLFCVVHDLFQTDTADYADILLPATSQLEHFDVHASYGHLHVQANRPSIAPLGEALPNTEVFRRLAARMGFDEPCLSRRRTRPWRGRAFGWSAPGMQGMTWTRSCSGASIASVVAVTYAPFADGGFPTPSGKCEFWSETMRAQRATIRCRRWCCRANRDSADPARARTLPARLHLAARAQLPQLVVREPAVVRRRGAIAAAADPPGRCRTRAGSSTARG